MAHRCRFLAALLLVSPAAAAGQTSSITVDCSGVDIPSGGVTATVPAVSNGGTILAATGYQFAFNPMVYGTGFYGFLGIGGSAGSPKSLAEVLDKFYSGGQRVLFGAVRNPTGTLGTLLDTEVVGGTYLNLTVSLTFRQRILDNAHGEVSITDIHKPDGLGIHIQSGGAVYSVWTPLPPVVSEWQFQGDLMSVNETGAAPTSGPAKIRYLDAAAFGTILGGIGSETTPNSSTPHDVTLAQSSFGTTASFGLPPIGGVVDTVYRTSPPRNASAPTDTAKSRGLGLTLWPNTRENWPEDRNGQYTVVWDMLIPSASWNAANAASAESPVPNQAVPLIEDSANNNSAADAIIRVSGGAASVGFAAVPLSATTATPAIQPDQWFRLALSVDLYGRNQSRIYVNGVLMGTTGASWVYNACMSHHPRWGDITPTTQGTAIPDDTWNGWGQFPSPWSLSPNTAAANTASTFSLFADINGHGQSVYVANLMFTDEAMSGAQVAALGGPNARGIVYPRPVPCPADFNHSGGVDVNDIFAYLAAWFSMSAGADFNGDMAVNVNDIFAFLAAWFAGCP